MTLVKTVDHKPAVVFGNLFDDLFGKPFSKWIDEAGPSLYPAFPPVNITETKEAYMLEVVSPGLEKEDFKIETEGNILSLSAEKKEEKKEENDKQIRKEYTFRSFKRSFTLNDEVDSEKIHAKYDKGVLQVVLPKKEEKIPVQKQIAVQ